MIVKEGSAKIVEQVGILSFTLPGVDESVFELEQR
jgi:hypothetical protein